MIDNNLLPAVRSLINAMSKHQKEQLIAELISEVGNLQPEISNTEPAQAAVVAEPASNEEFETSQSSGFSTNWGKNIEGKRAVRAQSNTWVDNGEDRDDGYNPDNYKKVPRQRQDSRNVLVEKTCSCCNKRFKVNPSLVYGEFFRCDRCTG